MDKSNELKALEAQWNTLDDSSIIRDVLFKGKFIPNAITFISNRNSITADEAKLLFIEVCDNIVAILIKNKQTFRASHVLKNAQINELYYFFNLYQQSSDSEIRSILYDYLCRNNPNFKDDECLLRAYHSCFLLLQNNIEKHAKYLDNVNRIYNNAVITVASLPKTSFVKFMMQPAQWRNDIAADVFYKSKREPKSLDLLPIIEKNCFFSYIIQNELHGLLRKWLNEQYLTRAGRSIPSTISERPNSFDEALYSLFRKWHFEESMMNQVSKKQKDVIRNEFAKLGLFESRENTQVSKKLNRFFTTHTFPENFSSLREDEITKFVLENNLVDLLPQKFINHEYIQSVLQEQDEDFPMYDELVLLENTKDLLSKETNLESFVNAMNVTSRYIQKYDNSFNTNQRELRFMNEIVTDNLENFNKISDINSFTRNLFHKLNTTEEYPTVEELLQTYHSINFDYIKDEFQNIDNDFIPSFDDKNLANIYGEKNSLTYLDYIKKYQGFYATYVFIVGSIKNSMTISRQVIFNGCEEVIKLIIQNHTDECLVNHAIAFLETFSIDTRKLRCYLQLLKLKGDKEVQNLGHFLDKEIKLSSSPEDIKNVEALEVYLHVNRFINPSRSYLIPYIEKNDWFRMILIAQYFNYPLHTFISICQENIKDRILCDNLIRAVSYEAPLDSRRHTSISKKSRALSNSSDSDEMFTEGKYLDSKHDLFAILLKCNENIVRIEKPFEEFQKFFTRDADYDDLLYEAKKFDWPLLAVLAGTTKLYRIKYCWLTWTILSSKFRWDQRYANVEEVSKAVFEHCIKVGFIKTLDESMKIFYPDAPTKIFTEFLKETAGGNFKGMESLLKLFVVKLNESDFRINILKGKLQLIPFIIQCLIAHLQYNIKFSNQQLEYLACVHRSEIEKFDGRIDFELMRKLCKIIEQTNVEINYEALYECEKKSAREVERICDELIKSNHFEAAIEIADLMNKSKTDFIFKYWLHLRKFEDQKHSSFDIGKYFKLVEMYGLDMDIFIKFLKLVIDEMDECVDKYKIMVFVLRNSTKGDFDELEYEIIHLYLRLKILGVKDITPLTSLYYENVIKAEKSLIHNTLYELKEIAMIDDIRISQCLTDEREIEELDQLFFILLDMSDFIQVLRIQAMFCYAPEDLKILVYMLSVSEGITSIYDITKQERQIISNYGQMSKKFNRLALRALRSSTSTSLSMDSSMVSTDLNESSIIEEPLRYNENKETLQALQGLLCKLKHGIKYGQRIVLIYRISLFLHEHTFNDLIKVKSSFEFLEIVSSCACDNKLIAMNDIIEAMDMTRQEVAQFISKEITVCIIKTRFLQFNKDTESSSSNLNMAVSMASSLSGSKLSLDDIWGFSLSKDLHLILELCKGRTMLLGTYLVKFYKIMSQSSADIPIKSELFDDELKVLCEQLNNSLAPQVMSLKKQNIIRVELLITAHDCFCHECSTEGIGEILHLSKILINELAEKKNFNLIVKLMCGIARYREMFYCFDILIKNEAFETLLGHFSDKQTNGLKNALLSYLNENHPNNIEYFKMCASHFLMHTELAKMYRTSVTDKVRKFLSQNQVKLLKSARILTNQIQQIEVPYLKCTKASLAILNEALTDMIHATEMMTDDKKIEMSLKYSAFCELIAMQMNLLKIGIENESKICPCVLYQESSVEKSQLISQYLANYELSVPQSTILNKNLEIPIDYTKAIYCRVLISGDKQYFQDFIARLDLTDVMIENLVKLAKFEAISAKQEKILYELCLMVHDVGLKFRLASMLGLKGVLQQLLNDEQSYYYLLDSKYGNNDIYQ